MNITENHSTRASHHCTYRATADRALTRFAKGDSFVAEGYVRSFQIERDGEIVDREEFVAKKIGHDLARTTYEVDRARRSPAVAERDAPRFDPIVSAESGPTRASSDILTI